MRYQSLSGLLMAIMVFGFFGVANAGIPYGNDDELFVHLNILSSHDEDIDDASLRAFVYSTDQYSAAGKLDLDENSNTARMIQFSLEDQQNEFEPVRVVVYNNDIREVKHVWTWMGSWDDY